MNQLTTQGIILGRTDYGEADRILTMLTPDHGKLRLMAKGVRRVRSKLAGGIELFSVSDVTYIKGRGDIGTLISTRLVRYYKYIVSDINRTMLGYDLIKLLNKVTETSRSLSISLCSIRGSALSTTCQSAWILSGCGSRRSCSVCPVILRISGLKSAAINWSQTAIMNSASMTWLSFSGRMGISWLTISNSCVSSSARRRRRSSRRSPEMNDWWPMLGRWSKRCARHISARSPENFLCKWEIALIRGGRERYTISLAVIPEET
jgi:hypothetical protein